MHTREAKLGRKEKGSFFSSFPSYLLGMPRICLYLEIYYMEGYYTNVIQSK